MELRLFRRYSGRTGIALVAAYLLVVQALLGSFALGIAAASPLLDAFGNPLCITTTDAAGTDTDRGIHDAVPDCCTVACSMFAPAPLHQHGAGLAPNPTAVSVAVPSVRSASAGPRLHPARSPGSPRSPPFI